MLPPFNNTPRPVFPCILKKTLHIFKNILFGTKAVEKGKAGVILYIAHMHLLLKAGAESRRS